MKLAFINCAGGVSGKAILGALVGLGASPGYLEKEIESEISKRFKLSFNETSLNGVAAIEVRVDTDAGQDAVPVLAYCNRFCPRENAGSGILVSVLKRYANAHSRLRGIPVEKIALAENELLRASAVILGTVAALREIGVTGIVSSPLPIRCDSGSVDDDTPLVLELARGAKIGGRHVENVTCTPFGVALLSAIAEKYGPLPEMQLIDVGYGAVEKLGKAAGTLQIILGRGNVQGETCGKKETITVIETSIDDMNPQLYPFLIEKLLEAGAQEAYVTPVCMKKGRPGSLLAVLCRNELLENMLEIIFSETTTLGVRIREERRRILARYIFTVNTDFGELPVKAGFLEEGGPPVQLAPEFEKCKEIALKQGVPLKEVYAAAQRAASDRFKKSGR